MTAAVSWGIGRRCFRMKKILVVDDSPVARSFHINILKTSGYLAEGAGDGIEALEKALGKNFDLILSDINMPNMDGLTFIGKYRENERETPVIVISTQEEATQKMKGYEAGADLYLVKPVKPVDLVNYIRMLIGE